MICEHDKRYYKRSVFLWHTLFFTRISIGRSMGIDKVVQQFLLFRLWNLCALVNRTVDSFFSLFHG